MKSLRKFLTGRNSDPLRYRLARTMGLCAVFTIFILALMGSVLYFRNEFLVPEPEKPQLPEVRTWSMILDGANPHYDPVWTPDGKRLVFNYYGGRDDPGANYVAGVAEPTLVRLSVGDREFHVDYSPDVSPDGSWIVYATTRHPLPSSFYGRRLWRSFDVEIAALDVPRQVRLTIGNENEISPAWSPLGNIAFAKYDRVGEGVGFAGIYTMTPSRTDQRLIVRPNRDVELEVNGIQALVTDGRLLSGPTWSPDGQFLVYVVDELVAPTWKNNPNDGNIKHFTRNVLYSVRADGSELTRLFTTRGNQRVGDFLQWQYVGGPTWSPNGQRIAFMVYQSDSDSEGEFDLAIYTTQIDGSEIRRRVETTFPANANISGLSWSPVDSQILFAVRQDRAARETLYVADVNNGEIRRIANGSYASWSPDGSRIAVVSKFSDAYLFTVDPLGMDQQVLVTINDGMKIMAANR